MRDELNGKRGRTVPRGGPAKQWQGLLLAGVAAGLGAAVVLASMAKAAAATVDALIGIDGQTHP